MLVDQYNPFEGKMLQILDKDGNVLDENLVPQIPEEDLVKLMRTMLYTRIADRKALMYQRQGRMLTYAPNEGQEACQVGSAYALEKKDWMAPAFRELGAWLQRGVDLKTIYLYWYGNEMGSKVSEDIRILPVSVPISSQLLHAVGLAMAAKKRGLDEVSIAYFGDGGTSEGDFHEALNLAGVYKAATVFFCQNNQWSISVPKHFQTASETFAQKAYAYGFKGIKVDGNDILAVYAATKEAIERGRRGEGPTLIEGYTYRLGPHTTSDDPTRYREEQEVDEWREKDPIKRFRSYLVGKGLWNEEMEVQFAQAVDEEVERIFKEVEQSGNTLFDDIFKYQYEKMTPLLEEEYEEYKAFFEERGML
ncbi:pyruvate dehydrogenase E1 component alpha subunit [Anaerosolibacter carboniphilus]|uniref:Pyruvate dehydrogenase E1 component subunit alpha n=1 Tax=Anaerosolibacter carboniphilus TaxID=1417629 RepID=A0A841L986_9FIRM|nr:pyruvate dehydrogenase (acetyl-transferring) E1 component subunit alpha [Anaerosolibacter carboniphilus]MBB6218939.1 pyruvate dehydrogenase E1 component alpha subunit [Anaerosolibacter carboniphilus]